MPLLLCTGRGAKRKRSPIFSVLWIVCVICHRSYACVPERTSSGAWELSILVRQPWRGRSCSGPTSFLHKQEETILLSALSTCGPEAGTSSSVGHRQLCSTTLCAEPSYAVRRSVSVGNPC